MSGRCWRGWGLDRVLLAALLLVIPAGAVFAQGGDPVQQSELDERVRSFLDRNQRSWRDMNVPRIDGQKLYELILENGYTRAVEVGTSTGHSGIWMAWALSKTGGKLLTIEIDEQRHSEALANFEAAGLSQYVDARLADAHVLVPDLPGPYDFVFLDADKDWYLEYFQWLYPKLVVGGCVTAHNVAPPRSGSDWRSRGRRGARGTEEFVEALLKTSDLETEFFQRGSGLSISYRKPASEPPDPLL